VQGADLALIGSWQRTNLTDYQARQFMIRPDGSVRIPEALQPYLGEHPPRLPHLVRLTSLGHRQVSKASGTAW
jgi:hypothetical protein